MPGPSGPDDGLTAGGRPQPPSAMQVVAAVDLGSNSFHMIVACFAHGRLTVVDRLREMVLLGGGLDRRQRIDPATTERAIACLRRFEERLRPVERVRAVGTNTLRRAREDRRFLARAEQALGQPIEIISGIEEARLVYLGAARTAPGQAGRRLVVDIGGGSTELAIGTGTTPEWLESLHLGCVETSDRHFAGGVLTADRFERARAAAREALQPIAGGFRTLGWSQVLGTSGTIRATADILRAMGYVDGVITPARLAEVAGRMIAAANSGRLALAGLPEERISVYPGGLAILQEVCASLGIVRLQASEGALREGLLYDLLSRCEAR